MNNTDGLDRFEPGDLMICERMVYMIIDINHPMLVPVRENPSDPESYIRVARGEIIAFCDRMYRVVMDFPKLVLQPIAEDR